MNKAAFSAQGVTFNDPPPLYFTTQLPREPSGTFPPKGKAHAQESWPAFLSASDGASYALIGLARHLC